jgi:hypothetical protein
LVDQYNHSASGYNTFLKSMSKYGKSAPDTNDEVLSGWVGVQGMVQVIKALAASHQAVNRADIVNYLSKQTSFDVDGLSGPINYTKPATILGGTVPREFTTRVWLAYAKDGKEQSIDNNKAFSLPG